MYARIWILAVLWAGIDAKPFGHKRSDSALYGHLSLSWEYVEQADRYSTRNGAYPLDVVDQLEAATMPRVEAWMAKKGGNCTLANAAVRREWYALIYSHTSLEANHTQERSLSRGA